MENTAECLEMRPSTLRVSKVFCNHDDDKMEHVEADGLLDDDPTVQEKNKKKKKKHKGGLPSPRRILAFNTLELSKLDEQKAEMKTCATCIVKTLSKSATFPRNATLKENCLFVEGSGDSEDSRECTMLSSPVEKISVLTRVSSLPLKSALRGGYEELGIGPRPKLHVKWAPTVWDPPCSTISHTVNKGGSKDPKHGKKGSHKRQDKKKHHKTKCDSGSSIVRTHRACYNDVGKEAGTPLQADILIGNQKLLTSDSSVILPELESTETDASNVVINCELVTQTHTDGDVADVGLTVNLENSVHYPLESTCGGSLFEPERVACNFLYRQAM